MGVTGGASPGCSRQRLKWQRSVWHEGSVWHEDSVLAWVLAEGQRGERRGRRGRGRGGKGGAEGGRPLWWVVVAWRAFCPTGGLALHMSAAAAGLGRIQNASTRGCQEPAHPALAAGAQMMHVLVASTCMSYENLQGPYKEKHGTFPGTFLC